MKVSRLIGLLGLAFAGFAGSGMAAEPIAIGISIAQSPPGSVVQGTQVKDAVGKYDRPLIAQRQRRSHDGRR